MPEPRRIIVFSLVLLLAGAFYFLTAHFQLQNYLIMRPVPRQPLKIEKLVVNHDRDKDGVPDLDDIVAGARKEVQANVSYRSAYYQGGYPPEDEGVCTDLIWRALKNAGYDLKAMMDEDIKKHVRDYPRVNGRPDPNIDFRRVQNQVVFFQKYAENLTTQIKPGDPENLRQWQGGDIVAFGWPFEHIGIVSDRRRPDGVPLLIHNAGPYPREEDRLLTWPSKITHHFRYTIPDR
ncbi:DUF1287 domain-containing protein [Desulfofundulus thermobenzoicus]|uniref:DUF1287 domain-containing protein n=1 Tax=Desulfofundulus thermobenzoicus TaxID=29376 RepID=A0A6N7ISR6_9FIRM|nr:DUF1287 domain-containing protein [Desulfofundulus thermobenzoicus]HHW43791.1 DUF1287 domain-containing protein [Desulfotomaculum sp.]